MDMFKRDKVDFDALYQRHRRVVWAVAYKRWLNADIAHDITQEAFLRLWKQWEGGEPILNPRAWLLRVARNLAEDDAKSTFRRNGTHPPVVMNGIPCVAPSPRDALLGKEAVERLRAAIQRLCPSQREALVRHHLQDQSIAEIARTMGRTEQAVKLLLHRARVRLQKLLAEDGELEASV